MINLEKVKSFILEQMRISEFCPLTIVVLPMTCSPQAVLVFHIEQRSGLGSEGVQDQNFCKSLEYSMNIRLLT